MVLVLLLAVLAVLVLVLVLVVVVVVVVVLVVAAMSFKVALLEAAVIRKGTRLAGSCLGVSLAAALESWEASEPVKLEVVVVVVVVVVVMP